MRQATSTDRRLLIAVLLLAAGNAAGAEPDDASGAVSGGVWRYAQRWAARYDADRDGRLAATEWPARGELPPEADADRDAVLSVDELAQYIARYGAHRKIRLMPASFGGGVPLPSLLRPGESTEPEAAEAGGPDTVVPAAEPAADEPADDEPTAGQELTAGQERPEAKQDQLRDRKYFVLPSRLPAGLPAWFRQGDRDGDGQLTLAEYAEVGPGSADKEFARLDRNRDGLLTPRELLGPAAFAKPAPRGPAAPPAVAPTEAKPEPPKADSGEGAAPADGEAAKSTSGEAAKSDSGGPAKTDGNPAVDPAAGSPERRSRRHRDS